MSNGKTKLAYTAAAQDNLVTMLQCERAGLSRSLVSRKVAAREWTRVHRGVYLCGVGELSFRQRCRAAILATGVDSVLSHGTAARLWDLRTPRDNQIHILVPHEMRRDIPRVAVHRSRALDQQDQVEHCGLPVTSLVRTTLDLAGSADDFLLRALVDKSLRSNEHHFELLEFGSRPSITLPGAARVRALLAENDDPADSVMESFMMELSLMSGAPGRRQYPINLGGYQVHADLAWPQIKLAVEVDSVRYHGTPKAMARDRERDRDMQLSGWMVARYMAQVLQTARVRDQTLGSLTHLIAKRAATWKSGVREPAGAYRAARASEPWRPRERQMLLPSRAHLRETKVGARCRLSQVPSEQRAKPNKPKSTPRPKRPVRATK